MTQEAGGQESARVPRRKRHQRIRKPAVATQPSPDRSALNVNEVAWELHCSPNMVWSLIRTGALPSFKVGRKRLISRSALESFMERGGTAEASS